MLNGRTALVTGSVGGLCLAIAERLAADGADIVLHGLTQPAKGDAEARRIGETYGVVARYMAADLRNPTEIERLTTEAGAVDILVNGAVFRTRGPVEDMPAAEWDDALAVNVSAAFHAIRLTLPGMKAKGWGRIVNISSVLGLRGAAERVDYVTTKTALIGMTKAIALETATHGVTCNAVTPGTVPTPPILAKIEARAKRKGRTVEDAQRDYLAALHPTGRFVEAENVAALVAFLCSEPARDITGAVLPIDGGRLAQ